MGIHKGTKLTETPKNQIVRTRIDEETANKLEFLVKKQKTTKSEVVRKGIEIQYEQHKK